MNQIFIAIEGEWLRYFIGGKLQRIHKFDIVKVVKYSRIVRFLEAAG